MVNTWWSEKRGTKTHTNAPRGPSARPNTTPNRRSVRPTVHTHVNARTAALGAGCVGIAGLRKVDADGAAVELRLVERVDGRLRLLLGGEGDKAEAAICVVGV